MTQGRHARPAARGGGLDVLLAILVGAGAVAVALAANGTSALRLGLVALAVIVVVQLLLAARLQRRTNRSLAWTEERLRTLEHRSRVEGDELHRRVLTSVSREGELRNAVEILATEISRLRSVLDHLQLSSDQVASLVVPSALDLPLLQQSFAQPPPERTVSGRLSETGWPPEAGAAAAAAAAAAVSTGQGASWLVREILVEGEVEPRPVASVVDLADVETRTEERSDEKSEPADDGSWHSFARPA